MKQVYKMTLDQWREAALANGGGDFMQTKFRCPLCKHVATPQDFKDAGSNPESAATQCIGRVTGAYGGMHVKETPMLQPCDWAAFGLFGTLDTGIIVMTPDGKEVNVFSFADDDCETS
jgi:hypothetical protein